MHYKTCDYLSMLDCACARNAGNVLPATAGERSRHASQQCVTHVPWCMPGSLTSGFLWSQWREKRSQHSRRMRNPQFYVSGKRPMAHHPNIVHRATVTNVKHQSHLEITKETPCVGLLGKLRNISPWFVHISVMLLAISKYSFIWYNQYQRFRHNFDTLK